MGSDFVLTSECATAAYVQVVVGSVAMLWNVFVVYCLLCQRSIHPYLCLLDF